MTRLSARHACVAALLLAASPQVNAASFKISTDPDAKCSAIEFNGEIGLGDEQRFKSALQDAQKLAPLRRLYLNSGGGLIVTAFTIAEIVRHDAKPVETIVRAGQQCSSACIVLLAAGEKRNVSTGATLVVHQARQTKTMEPSLFFTAAIGYYLTEYGFSKQVVKTFTDLKPDQELIITASNARRFGFDGLRFFGSTLPPATRDCSWEGFLAREP